MARAVQSCGFCCWSRLFLREKLWSVDEEPCRTPPLFPDFSHGNSGSATDVNWGSSHVCGLLFDGPGAACDRKPGAVWGLFPRQKLKSLVEWWFLHDFQALLFLHGSINIGYTLTFAWCSITCFAPTVKHNLCIYLDMYVCVCNVCVMCYVFTAVSPSKTSDASFHVCSLLSLRCSSWNHLQRVFGWALCCWAVGWASAAWSFFFFSWVEGWGMVWMQNTRYLKISKQCPNRKSCLWFGVGCRPWFKIQGLCQEHLKIFFDVHRIKQALLCGLWAEVSSLFTSSCSRRLCIPPAKSVIWLHPRPSPLQWPRAPFLDLLWGVFSVNSSVCRGCKRMFWRKLVF